MTTIYDCGCGTRASKRYAHEGDAIKRWGREDSHAIIAGQKVAIQRPRLRGPNGEVPLTRYETFRQEGRMQRAVAGKVMRRVPCSMPSGALTRCPRPPNPSASPTYPASPVRRISTGLGTSSIRRHRRHIPNHRSSFLVDQRQLDNITSWHA